MQQQQKGLQFKTLWETKLKTKIQSDKINEHIINQYNSTQETINLEDIKKFNLSYFTYENKCYRNIWIFRFRSDNEIFKGKKIEGLLYFPPEYPQKPPEFFFGHLQDGSYLKHINIYLSNELCVVVLNAKYWKDSTECIDILYAISNTFDVANEESPANASFAQCPRFIQDHQQQLQSELLEVYEE